MKFQFSTIVNSYLITLSSYNKRLSVISLKCSVFIKIPLFQIPNYKLLQ